MMTGQSERVLVLRLSDPVSTRHLQEDHRAPARCRSSHPNSCHWPRSMAVEGRSTRKVAGLKQFCAKEQLHRDIMISCCRVIFVKGYLLFAASGDVELQPRSVCLAQGCQVFRLSAAELQRSWFDVPSCPKRSMILPARVGSAIGRNSLAGVGCFGNSFRVRHACGTEHGQCPEQNLQRISRRLRG